MVDIRAIRAWKSNAPTRRPQGLYLTQTVHGVTVSWPGQGRQVQTMKPSPVDFL